MPHVTSNTTAQQLRTEIAKLEYERWQAIFEGASDVLIQDWNDALEQRRHELVQVILKGNND